MKLHRLQYPLRILDKAGKTLWFQLKGSLITWENKTATLNMFTDITEQKDAEIALKKSEEKYRLMVETSNDVVFTFNDAEKLVYISPSIKNTLGYNPSELVGHPFEQLVHPDDMQSLRQAIQRNIKTGSQTAGGNEYRVRHASGEWRWHVASGSAMFDANGKFINFTAIAKDITDRKNTEQALQASENNFRATMESSLMGIRIMGDADYTLYANQALLDMFGYKNIEELRASPPQEHYSAESYAAFIKRKEQFASGEALTDRLEPDIIRKDGKVRHIQIFSKNVFWNGKQQYQLIYNDITERKQAEDALRQNEEKYRLIVENTRDVIFSLNPRGEYVYISPSIKTNLGYNQSDLISHPFISFVHPEDLPIIQEEIRRTNKHGYQTTENREYRVRHASGEWRWVVSRGTKIVDTNGNFLNFIGIARDITEQKLIEDKLKTITVRQGELLAAIPDIVMEVDNNKIYKWANQTGLDFFGDDVIGKEAALYFEGEQNTYDTVKPLFDGEDNTFYVESWQRRKDGQKRLLAWRCRVLKDAVGNVTGALSSAQDITENKRAEEALKASEQNFHNSLDTFLIGIRITSLDCHALYVNKAFLEMFGYENIEEARISPPQEHYTTESYAEYLRRKELFERGESVPNAVDSDIIHKEGAIRHLRIFNNTVFWDGKEHYQSLYLDITERIMAEKRLEQAAQEWRTTFDSITDLISIHSKDNRILRVNKAMATMLKTTPQELVGKFCHEVMHGAKEPPVNCPHRQTLINGIRPRWKLLNIIWVSIS